MTSAADFARACREYDNAFFIEAAQTIMDQESRIASLQYDLGQATAENIRAKTTEADLRWTIRDMGAERQQLRAALAPFARLWAPGPRPIPDWADFYPRVLDAWVQAARIALGLQP